MIEVTVTVDTYWPCCYCRKMQKIYDHYTRENLRGSKYPFRITIGCSCKHGYINFYNVEALRWKEYGE